MHAQLGCSSFTGSHSNKHRHHELELGSERRGHTLGLDETDIHEKTTTEQQDLHHISYTELPKRDSRQKALIY